MVIYEHILKFEKQPLEIIVCYSHPRVFTYIYESLLIFIIADPQINNDCKMSYSPGFMATIG